MMRRHGRMDCRQVCNLLPLYADGDLESTTQARVAEHVTACPACRERADLDRRLAVELSTYAPAADCAAMQAGLRRNVMAEVDKERRRRPFRRAMLSLGHAATWVGVAAIAATLVIAIAISARPLAQQAWQAGSPTAVPACGIGWQVTSEQTIAAPYYDDPRVDRTPQLSPDGSKIAYLPTVDGQATDIDRLLVRDLATGKDLDLTPEEGYSYTSVRWSPDSRSLAFVKYRMEKDKGSPSELWRVDADGTNLVRLFAAQHDGGPATRGPSFGVLCWSADGRDIWTAGTWGYVRVHADGSGTEAVVLPTPVELGARDDAPTRVAISPAGDYVLWAVKTDGLLAPPAGAPTDGTSLVRYDLKSKESRVLCSFAGTLYFSGEVRLRLTAGSADESSSAGWLIVPGDVPGLSISPEGDWISFTSLAPSADGATPEAPRLWVMRRDGSDLREVMLNGYPAPAHMPGPLWAGGGRAYFNQPPEVSAIWLCEVDAASGQAGLIGHKAPARDLASVSRDGRRLLVVRGEWEQAELVLLTLAPKPTVAPTATPSPSGLGVAPERLILYHGGQSDAFGPEMGVYAALATEVEKALLAVRPGTVAGLQDPAAEAARIKAQQVAIEAVYPAPGISPAGQGPYTTALIRLDQATSPHEVTILLGTDRYTRAVTVDAGEALQMLRRILGVPEPQAAVPEFGAARDLFTLPASAGFYRVSPDGAWLLYPVPGGVTAMGDLPPHLEADSIADGQMQTIALFAADAPGGLADAQATWFPDSRRVLVTTSGAGGQMLTMTLDQAVQTLARAPQGSLGFGEAAISPDGGRIAYTVLYPANPAPVPKIGIEVMNADGSGRRQIVTPDFFIGRLAWATGPGGANLFYFKGQGGTPPEGGKMYEVGADNAPAPAVPQPVAAGMRLAACSPGNTLALWLSEPADERGRADLYLSAWPVVREPTLAGKGVDTSGVAWAGSDDWFVYSQDGALYLAPAARNATARRLTPEGEEADAPLWVAGKGLIYRVARDGRAALRLLPLKGAQPVATAEQRQAQVELDFFSGVAAPKWELSAAQVKELTALLAGLARTDLPMPQPAGPGYTGFRLKRLGADPAGLPERLRAVGGVAEVQNGSDTYRLTDPERRLERWFLATAKSTIGDALYALVETAIAHDVNAGLGSFKALHMVDGRTGWALAERAILRTTDGGTTWADVTPQSIATPKVDGNVHWAGQQFIDAEHAWVAMSMASNLAFLRTADGGRTWQVAKLPVQGMGVLFTSLDAQRGWALVGQDAAAGSEAVAVLGTQDGGATWTALSATDPQNPQPGQMPFGGIKSGLGFRDATNGWLSLYQPVDGKILLYATHDGGRTWAEQAPALPKGYEDAQASPLPPVFFNAQEGVLAVGLWRHEPMTLFYVTRDGGATWNVTGSALAAVGGAVRSTFVSADEGWALVAPLPGTADQVELRHTVDGGRTWTALSTDAALAQVLALDFVDGQHGWALCTDVQNTYLLRTADGGKTWARVP